MSVIGEGLKFLAQWPVAEGFFIIVISFLGVITYRRAERDRQTLGMHAVEIPLFFLSGPLHDAMSSVHNISEQTRTTNDLLRQIVEEMRRQNGLMEWIGNQAGMNGPPRR